MFVLILIHDNNMFGLILLSFINIGQIRCLD